MPYQIHQALDCDGYAVGMGVCACVCAWGSATLSGIFTTSSSGLPVH